MSDNPTTRAIREAICRRYGEKNQYLIAHEVGNDVGFGITNYADIIAISNWKSRGLGMVGFEIKASRSDWQRELKSPQKAEAFAPYCREWWIAAAPGIVKHEELPTGWGLMELVANGALRVKHPCAINKAPEPCPWPLAVMLMRRFADGRSSDVRAAAAALVKDIRSRADADVASRVRWHADEYNRIIKRAEQIQAASGIDLLHGWEPVPEIAAALQAAKAIKSAKRDAGYARNSLRAALKQLDAALAFEEIDEEIEG